MNRCFIVIFIIGVFSSCVVSKELYGDYDESKSKEYHLKNEKEIFLFWDLIQTRKIDGLDHIKDYEKVVKRNFFDAVVYYGSFGIFSFYTIKIKVNKENKEIVDGNQ